MKKAISITMIMLLLLFLPACQPTPSITPENTVAPSPPGTTAPSSEGAWRQDETYTAWATRESENILGNMDNPPAPASVVKVLPLVEFVLDYRTAYDFYHGQFDGPAPARSPEQNEHNIGDGLYTWGLMANLFCAYGQMHPEVDGFMKGEIQVSEQAARDFMFACFSEYTGEWSLPAQPPDGWSEAPIGYTGAAPGTFMQFNGDGYTCSAEGWNNWLTGSVQRYVIITGQEWDNSEYFLHILKIYGPDELDMAGYYVYLSKNDEPDVFGFEWRISRIVKVSEVSSVQ